MVKQIMKTRKKKILELNNEYITDNSGNSMPIILLVFLVVMIIGSAVAYSTSQVFSIVRSEEHNQMTYLAAESALQRSMANLDRYLPREDFATDRGITYNDEEQFIDDLVRALNSDSRSEIINNFTSADGVQVYSDSSMNTADVSLSFSWDGSERTRIGNKLRFPLEITATAKMENGMFKSNGRKAVAVKEYEVWIYNPFELNGAVYTLGDLVVNGGGTSTITGDVYVFGTGFDKPNRMDQYHMGGICAYDSAKLHIEDGSAFTRNLLRVGSFYETGTDKCAIIVDNDVVAQSIQAFGINNDIVIIRDAYTFDDIEMNGADSYIAINGNFFGMNPGDDNFHDTSSAVVNISQMYAYGTVNEYTRSRIVINGYTFINGSTFKMNPDGTANHKLEDVSLAWQGNQPVYIVENKNDTMDYMTALTSRDRNGFSVLLGDIGWSRNERLNEDWATWTEWITEIKSVVAGMSNTLPSTPPAKIKGFCHNAMAANNTLYPSNVDSLEIPGNVICHANVDGLDSQPLNDYYSDSDWWFNKSAVTGIPKGLENMMYLFESHVSVFARKKYPNSFDGDISYNFNSGMIPSGGSTTEFLRIRDALDNIDTSLWSCVVKFPEGGNEEPVDLVQHLEDYYGVPSPTPTPSPEPSPEPDPDPEKFFLIINLNPNRELVISRDKVNGIIFTMGKLTIENGATLNGAVISAGRGYDPVSGVEGSAADSYVLHGERVTRLPRVVEDVNIHNFRNGDYAALVIQNGGNISFPGRDELFDKFELTAIGFKDILKEIF